MFVVLSDAPVFIASGAENHGAVWLCSLAILRLSDTFTAHVAEAAWCDGAEHFQIRCIYIRDIVIYHDSSPQFVCLGQFSTSSPWGAGAQGHTSIAKQATQEAQRNKGRALGRRWNAVTNSSY